MSLMVLQERDSPSEQPYAWTTKHFPLRRDVIDLAVLNSPTLELNINQMEDFSATYTNGSYNKADLGIRCLIISPM